ncbi:MAG: sortase [Anaerolineae bacterium]|nr:sortase [Anaerolineae bacterium]
MQSKVYLALIITLSSLTILTSPPVMRPLLQQAPTPTPTPVTPTITPTPTMTPDPFANVPTATPRTDSIIIEVNALPSPALGDLPPTYTPTPLATSPSSSPAVLLPDPSLTDYPVEAFPAPTPATLPPDHLRIPRLALDVPVVPVGMVPVPGPGAFISPAMPNEYAAGWLNTSASFGQTGNMVLTGRHQLKKMTVLHGLWTLEPGDEIDLYAGEHMQGYRVAEVEIVPEQDQPTEVRLANTEFIRPTEDERLTLVTGWPEKSNSHRTIVIAFPEE